MNNKGATKKAVSDKYINELLIENVECKYKLKADLMR
jgi:hypothetical protein